MDTRIDSRYGRVDYKSSTYDFCRDDQLGPGSQKQTRSEGVKERFLDPDTGVEILVMQNARFIKSTVSGGTGHIDVNQSNFGYINATIDGDIASLMDGFQNPFINNVVLPPQLKDLESRATTAAYAKLVEPDFNAAEALAEIGETFSLMKAPMRTLISFAKRMVRESTRKASKWKDTPDYYVALTDAATTQWLEYRYGIRPVLMTVDDLAKAAAFGMSKVDKPLKSKRRYVKYTEEIPVTCGNVYPRIVYNMHWAGKATCQHKASCVVYYRDRMFMTAAKKLQNLGFSPTQLLPFLWERTPFSFVADWFVNVDDWLAACSPKPTLDVIASCHTYKRTFDALYAYQSGYSTISGKEGVAQVDPFRVNIQHMLRTLDSAVPTSPTWNREALNLKKQIDSVSLIWNVVVPLINPFKTRVSPSVKIHLLR